MSARDSADFYDDLASRYHLVYPDWDAAIAGSSTNIDALIREEWNGSIETVLDAAAGIGTQSLGLAALGYRVTASDAAERAIERARREAAARGVRVRFATADLRHLSHVHEPHDLVLAWDNALPHLFDDEMARAIRECFACTAPSGGCLFSVRDYEHEPRTSPHMIPYGVRQTDTGRVAVFQVRDWDGDHYDLSFFFVEELDGTPRVQRVEGGRYYAATIDRILELMRQAGYSQVRRVDGRFFQPALLGRRAT